MVDEWWGHEKYTLGNVLKYLRENKARGEEMSSITPGVFLAGVAEEMRNMREIGWARERVIGAEEYKKAKDEYEEAFSAFYDKASEIGREAGGGYFDLADAAMYNLLELVQGGKRMPARESVARALEQSGGKWTEESVDAAMHLLDKALGMPSDYMEAVPQRAVNMSEWEYAVLPKGLKKNKEVTDALKANGIQPIWHDGTDEGRKAALAGLVNEPTVSFNIAGANEQDAYAAERAEIERAARENGTWLKAPNGKDSKLTPEQWTAVRTRAFKRWFGDWEKDPEHASRVVDENGEPLVVYHGTRRGGFRVFRTEGRGKTSDTGAFFSSSRDNAEGYAMNEDGEVPKDMLYEVFLNIREPETVDFKGNNWNRVPDRPVGYIVKFKSGDTEWYDNRDEAESAADMYESDPGTVEEDWGDGSEGFTIDDLAREVREEGYSDGLIAENIIDHAATGRRVSNEPATDYIVFDPTQIKSATDNVGTYDAGNADITFSLTIGKDRICNTRQEAVKMIGRNGQPIILANKFLEIEAEFSARGEKKLGHGHSKSVSVANLKKNGFDEKTAHMLHWTACGSIEDLFANAERMKFYRAYKLKEERKGSLHIFTPFVLEGIEKEFEAEIQILLYKQEGRKPSAYVLRVDVREKSRIPEWSRALVTPLDSRNAAEEIKADFPELVNTDFGNNTLAMTRGAEDALTILRKRETEREGERLIREWQKQCELWSKLGGTDDAKIGRGSRIFGEMMALVSATKGVLPPEYTRMRGLGMSLQWAEIYADMANSGEVPMRGEMKGSIYDKFVSAIEKRKEKDLLHGLTAEDAAENLKELAGRKLENIMQTVAETCRRHLESYLKGRERVRLEKVAGAAMPKEEPGKKAPRGKVAADIVRQVRNALELMDKERNEIADIIDDAREGLNRLDPDDPAYTDKEEALHEQAYMAKTFGNWEGMTLEEARAAADAMAQIVSNGRAAWKDKLDRERRHIKYVIGRVSRNFRVPLEEYQGAGAMRDIAEKSRGGKMLGKLPLNLMSFADLMLALRPVLGREFCDAQRAKLAEHHIRMQRFGNDLRRRMRDTAASITGLSNERDLAGWINALNQEEHTGIHRREKVEHSVVLTIEDAQRWLDMSELQRTAERERLKREAEEAELAPPTDIPTEEHIGLLQEELNKWQAKDEDARAKQKYLKASVTTERDMGEIVATKEGITPRGCRCSVSGRGESHHLCIPRIPWTPAQSR